jgi:hypothetical protein
MSSYENYNTPKEFNAILPNLKYKNKNIFFIFKNPLKIKKNNEVKFIKEYSLGNISLSGKIFCMGYELSCTILEKEMENGLEVNIKYIDSSEITRDHMKKFARSLEAKILEIDIEDNESDNDNMSEYSYENEYHNKIKSRLMDYDDEELDEGDIIENKNINNLELNDNDDYLRYEIDKF